MKKNSNKCDYRREEHFLLFISRSTLVKKVRRRRTRYFYVLNNYYKPNREACKVRLTTTADNRGF